MLSVHRRLFRICVIAFIGIVAACGDNVKETKETAFEEPVFIPDTILVGEVYPPFFSAEVGNVLEELGYCINDSVGNDSLSVCSHEIFRVFPIDTLGDFNEGFILDARMGALKGSLTKTVIVLKKLNEKYTQQNFYMGKLLELRTNKYGGHDMLIKYRVPGVGTVAIHHAWNQKKMAYEPIDVEEFNDRFIKEEYKDSINNLYLNNFKWGY